MTDEIKIAFRTADGEVFHASGMPGATVMETAVRNDVPGIEAECGGACACATCHVYAPETLGAAKDAYEQDMLDFTADERRPNSRLSCQIELEPALEGAVFDLPRIQV